MRVPREAEELADEELRATGGLVGVGARFWGALGRLLLVDESVAARLALLVVREGGARLRGEVGVDEARGDTGGICAAILPLAFLDARTASE